MKEEKKKEKKGRQLGRKSKATYTYNQSIKANQYAAIAQIWKGILPANYL